MASAYRVVIVDDERIARAGLRAMLSKYEHLRVVGEARDGDALIAIPGTTNGQSGFNSRIDSTVTRSAGARSAIEARAIITKAISAAGGLPALRAISTISTDRSMLRTSTGQGLRPGVAAVEHAILLNRLDLRSRRAFTLRDLERAVAMHRARMKCSTELVTRLFCGFWRP